MRPFVISRRGTYRTPLTCRGLPRSSTSACGIGAASAPSRCARSSWDHHRSRTSPDDCRGRVGPNRRPDLLQHVGSRNNRRTASRSTLIAARRRRLLRIATGCDAAVGRPVGSPSRTSDPRSRQAAFPDPLSLRRPEPSRCGRNQSGTTCTIGRNSRDRSSRTIGFERLTSSHHCQSLW